MSQFIYKITPQALWREAEANGRFTGAPIDIADGFIHFSTAAQAGETAAKHFSGQSDLLLVAIDGASLGPALKYEVSRGGALFPHLYGVLELKDVVWVKPLPLGADGVHQFPALEGAMSVLDRLGQKLLFTFDPETAHGMSIAALRCGLPVGARTVHDARLKVSLCGIDFPNPLGMAAGYDKNAEVPDALLGLGFGFAEVGTVTPLPQAGNPKPRIFRLTADEAVINRLGFNNEGHAAAEKRLAARKGRSGIVGVNIGANKDSTDRIGDYERGVSRFAPYASYLTVNISSPNTPGLRNMQAREQLGELLSRVMAARAAATAQPPIFLKIAPDLVEAELEDIAAEIVEKQIDGVIVSNTTISRPALRSTGTAGETGGLSGKPLFERSTIVLAKMRKLLGPDMAIIGVGGIDSTETALEKIRAGADLVQLYTSMIYAGPALPGRIVAGMARFCETERLKSIRELRDSRLDQWASKPLS